MKWSELIEVDARYQTSVNLRLDINNKSKVAEYIPTSASLRVLESYLDKIDNNEDNATLLIAPYGKGKSHLVLVLLNILQGKTKAISAFSERVKKIDDNIAKKIEKKRKLYLPVIITYGTEDLNSSYLIAIERALFAAGLDTLAPESAYQKAIDRISEWKERYSDVYEQFIEKYDSETIIQGLENKDQESYDEFVKIYPELTAGSQFKPLVEMHALKVYSEIEKVLRDQYGYAGMILVFDEFSKYIEMQDRTKDQLSGNMGLIQDMCELCTRKDNNMHHIFIAHKAIKEYGNYLSKETLNCFTGVEGRLHEEYFVTSIRDDFEVISQTIKIKKNKTPIVNKILKENNTTADYGLKFFRKGLDEKTFINLIEKGCFPLRPITSYLLLRISEIVGQNERSLFTFLAKKEPYSLNEILEEEMTSEGITPDTIYDYFSTYFSKSHDLPHVYDTYMKSSRVIEQMQELSEIAVKLVKTIALVEMIHQHEEILADDEVLSSAMGCDEEQYAEAIRCLVDNGVIRLGKRIPGYSFVNILGVDLDSEIEAKKRIITNFRVEKTLEDMAILPSELPHAHNQKYSITRYFDYVYMSDEAFLKLTSKALKEIYSDKFSDGKIFVLIRAKETDLSDQIYESVVNKISEMTSEKQRARSEAERTVIIIPEVTDELRDNLLECETIRRMIRETSVNTQEDKYFSDELRLRYRDNLYDVERRIKRYFIPGNSLVKIYNSIVNKEINDERSYNQLLSDICDAVYKDTPIIKHEMINRRVPSTQMRNARKKLNEILLLGEDTSKLESGTAPEATIYRATLMHTGVRKKEVSIDKGVKKCTDEINKMIKKAQKENTSFDELYDRLEGKGIGMRRGVIPVYLAYTFSGLSDMPVVYTEGEEYEITPDILERINQAPDEYELRVEEGTKEKTELIRKLAGIWGTEEKVQAVVDGMVRWMINLSQYAKQHRFLKDGNKNKQIYADKLQGMLITSRINPQKLIFHDVFENYGNNVSEIKKNIDSAKKTIERCLVDLEKELADFCVNIFGGDEGDSLFATLSEWYHFYGNGSTGKIREADEISLITCVEEMVPLSAHKIDQHTILNHIAKVELN